MKNLSKKIISLIMALLILVSAIPTNIFANGINENSKELILAEKPIVIEPQINPEYEYYLQHKDEYIYGYIPPKYILPIDNSSDSSYETRSLDIPEQYKKEYRTPVEFITSVKNQQQTGTCWAHAAISTIETLILKYGLADYDKLDLSEGHMAYNSISENPMIRGGNNRVALQYLSSLAGPVNEKNYPDYTIEGNGINNPNIKPMEDADKRLYEYYIPNTIVLENTVDNIKRCVFNYGSVADGYWSDPATRGKYTNYHYVYIDGNGKAKTNHQVTIIGWNDDMEIKGKKGAFLVKNSWGTSENNNGYYWISYASFTEGKRDPLIVFKDVEGKIENLKNLYTYSNHEDESSSLKYDEQGKIAGINIFDRKEKGPEEISKVTFYNPNNYPVDYDLYITQDEDAIQIQPGDKNPFSNSKDRFIKPSDNYSKWTRASSGSFDSSGFFTINLDKPYILDQDKFALRIELPEATMISLEHTNPEPGKTFTYARNVHNLDIYTERKDGNLYLSAITREVSDPKIEITGPEKPWETKEGYDLDNFDPLTLTVKNTGNISLNDMSFDLVGDDKDNFKIVNKEKELYLPRLEKGKTLDVQIKPTKQITLENTDKTFNFKLSVGANELENPVTKEFTFKVTVDKDARQKALEVAKAKAKGEITKEKLKDLSDEEISNFIKQIDDAKTIDAVNGIVKKAQNQNSENESARLAKEALDKAKTEAKNKINAANMPDLTKEQRDSFEAEITNATTIEAVNGIVEKAKAQNSENESARLAKEALDKAKLEAKGEITKEKLKDLSDEEISNFIKQIDDATKVEELSPIVEKAKAQNSENEIARLAKEDLDKAKAKAKGEITKEKLPYLNDKERKAFKDEIDKATKAEDLSEIVKRATEANKDAKDELDRENKAKNALEKLKTNDNVTKKDIDAVQNLIDILKNVDVKTDLQNKLNLIKSAHELSLKKTEAKETIDGLANIDGLKAGYLEEIDTAISTEVIDKIVEKATAKSKEITDFNKAKEDTKNKINSLENLKTEEKDKFLKDLDNIVDTAKIESVKSICLEAVKTNAKNIINDEALKDLTEKEKASALEKIEKATNEDEINKIVEAAKNQDKINKAAAKSLEEAKIKGKEIVNQDNMKFLTTDEIAAFIARIESATTPDKVKEVVNEATTLNHSRDLEKILNDKRKEAIKEIDELKNLEFSQIQMLKTKIANATSQDEITKVIEEARNLDRTNKLREDLENNSLWNYLPRIDRYERRVNPTPLAKASDKKDKGEKVETKTPVEIKMDSKLVIGSKTLVVTVDGVQKEVKMDVEPFISNNRTMLPIRFVAEALGLKVDWDDPSRTVILTDKDTVVKIPVDTNKIIVNGVEYESDTDPILKSNRTMLPIANIARALGLVDGKDIIWDSKTQSVTIKVNK